MFKLVVLCAFLAAAVAEPDPALFATPAFAPGIISPAARILPASSYVYQSPLISAPLSYSAPLGYAHLIKKRSAPLVLNPSSYIAPGTYLYSSPIVSSYSAAAPLIPAIGSGLAYSSGAHLIKKRSAPLVLSPYSFPSSYIAPGSYAYSSPVVSTYSAAAPLVPAVGSGLVYSSGAHFIKKRSLPLYPSAYIAPSSYISPLNYATPLVASRYSAPVLSTPLISYPTHLIKKRFAPGSYSHESRFEYKATGPVTTTYTSYEAPVSHARHVYPILI